MATRYANLCLRCHRNSPAPSNWKTGLSIFVRTFFLSAQRCGFCSPVPRHLPPPNQGRASPHQPLRSHDLYEISLAKCFARIPRNVRRIRPRLRKKFTRPCKRRNGRLPLLVALDRPRSQQFRSEKRSVSLPLLLLPQRLRFLLRSAHSISCDRNVNRSRCASSSVSPQWPKSPPNPLPRPPRRRPLYPTPP